MPVGGAERRKAHVCFLFFFFKGLVRDWRVNRAEATLYFLYDDRLLYLAYMISGAF